MSTGISKGVARRVAEGNWSGVSVNKLGVAFAKKFKFAETPSQYSLNVVVSGSLEPDENNLIQISVLMQDAPNPVMSSNVLILKKRQPLWSTAAFSLFGVKKC